MPAVVNSREHSLTSSNGVTLQKGLNTLTAEEVKKLADCPSVATWRGLGWVSMPQPDAAPAAAAPVEEAAPEQPAPEPVSAPESSEEQPRRGRR